MTSSGETKLFTGVKTRTDCRLAKNLSYRVAKGNAVEVHMGKKREWEKIADASTEAVEFC